MSVWSSDVCSSDLAIDGHALRLVDRGGIAVIDMGVILQVERDRAAIVQRHGHACRRDVLNRTERSVLYPQAALVAQEHDPVAGCEGALAPFGTDGNIFTKFAAGAQALARGLVQCPHPIIGMGKEDRKSTRLNSSH